VQQQVAKMKDNTVMNTGKCLMMFEGIFVYEEVH